MQYPEDWQETLDRVLWIAGAPDSGKTTVAGILAERHGFAVYHFDRHEMAHFARADPEQHPALWAAHPDRMDTEQRWLGSSPEAMATATIASWSDRCQMAFEEIAELAAGSPVIAEGPGFFPDLLKPLLSDPRKAVWLVPTEAFKRRSALERGKPGNRHETSDPERATANLIARDLIMGRVIQQQCVELGLLCLVVGRDADVDSIASIVEERFRFWIVGTD